MQRNVPLHVRSQRVGSLELDAPEEKWKPFVLTHFPSLWPSCTFSPPKCSRLIHKTCPSQQERLSSNCKFHSQGTTFVWISVGDSIGPSGCAAVPKLKFSITVLRDKAVLSQFHYLLPLPPPHTHTKFNTLDFGMKTMADLRQMNLPPMCNIT